ncbi:MAG: M43 family zinc metalloprotease [Crocinitomicaceae bacterium]|nr:M43 family zinc metalloprotease [Crocinitomicaceae bacterium]
MKNYITLVLLLLGTSLSFGQVTGEWCATDQRIQEQFAADPSLQEMFHQQMMAASQYRHNGEGSRATITVPVVVHIIHDNGAGNISDEQIQSALDVLNEDYNRLNADTTATRTTPDAPFAQEAGSMDMEFKLARIDPDGNCTNGIVRVNAAHLTYNAGEDCKYSSNGGSDLWPRDEYFNIWIVNSIDNGGAQGITLGYAYLPYGGAGGDGYGILMRHDTFGIIETAAGSDGRTLTHEMGHALGLNHIFDAGWGGGNPTGCHTNDCSANGDYSCDTPPQEEANWSCSQTWNSCADVPVGDAYGTDVMDQIENYMSYNACQNMFSRDQVNIMQANFVNISFLAGLIDPSNLIATGVNDPDQLCTAEFEALNRSICSGTVVDFSDFSFHAPNSWTWTISGIEGTDYNYVNGTSATSQEPSVEFLSSGNYDVELEVSDGVTTQTEAKTAYISVIPQPAAIDLIESFEAYTSFATTDQWSTYSAGGSEFEIVEGVSRTGWRSAKLQNYGQSTGNSDELISAPVDLSVIDPTTEQVTLSFRYSYKKRYESNNECLKVFITNDCGDSWVQRKTLCGIQLSSAYQNSAWTPTDIGHWTTVHMTNITSAYFIENFRYKFEFESDNGNNLYLEDINIYKGAPSDELVGIDENGNVIESMSVYPNPTAGNVNVRFAVANGAEATVQVTDLAGKQLQVHEIFAAAGNNLIELTTEGYASGVYLVEVAVGGVSWVERVVVD